MKSRAIIVSLILTVATFGAVDVGVAGEQCSNCPKMHSTTQPTTRPATQPAMHQKPCLKKAIVVHVTGMKCPKCVAKIEERLTQYPAVAAVSGNWERGKIYVTLKPGKSLSDKKLRKAIRKAGFTPGMIMRPGDKTARPTTEAVRPEGAVTVHVKGLSCPFCVLMIEKRVKKVDGVDAVSSNWSKGEIYVTVKSGASVSDEKLRDAIERAGFTPGSIDRPASSGSSQSQ